jgi:hypothetical protein
MGGDSDQLGWVGRPNKARPTPIDPMKTVVGSGDTGTLKVFMSNPRAFVL